MQINADIDRQKANRRDSNMKYMYTIGYNGAKGTRGKTRL